MFSNCFWNGTNTKTNDINVQCNSHSIRTGFARNIGSVFPNVSRITPDSIKCVKDGDMIEINIPERALNLKISEEELKQRKAAFVPPKTEIRGYLARYQHAVHSANMGGIVD